MERNDINPNKISYALYDLDTYRIPDDGKGTAGPLSLLPSSLLDNADVSLSTLKKAPIPTSGSILSRNCRPKKMIPPREILPATIWSWP